VLLIKNRKGNFWKILSIILAFLLIFVIGASVGAYYFVFNTSNSSNEPAPSKPLFKQGSEELPIENNIQDILDNNVVEPNHLDYILYQLEAYNLHNVPLSADLPSIEFNIDGEKFTSTVKDGKVVTEKGEALQKDIIIYTDQKTVFETVVSENPVETLQIAKAQGYLQVEMIANAQTLALKGYYPIYDKLISGTESSYSPSTASSTDMKRNYLIIVLSIIAVISALLVLSCVKMRKK